MNGHDDPAGPDAEGLGGFDAVDDIGGDKSRRRRLLKLLDADPGPRLRVSANGAAHASTRDGVEYGAESGDSNGAGHPASGGLRARLGRVCAVSVSEVGVSGAGVTVMGSVDDGLAGCRDQLWATGDLSRSLENLQLTAGEGPCLDAFGAGAPVLVWSVPAVTDGRSGCLVGDLGQRPVP